MKSIAWMCLVLALGYCLLVVTGDLRLMLADRAYVRRLGSQNATLMVTHIGGVDVFGRPYFPPPRSWTPDYVFFVLRARSLRPDVAYWQAVAAAVPRSRRRAVTFLAYCDGMRCAQDARAIERLPFRIIAFAAVNDMQAMINADTRGQSLVVRPGAAPLPPVQWRGGRTSPARAAEEIMDEIDSSSKIAAGGGRATRGD